MSENRRGNPDPERLALSDVALLWDESFLWGVMAYRALKAASLPFELIRSEDIRKGALAEYKLLFVPGGWASNKMKALGPEGIEKVKEFIGSGGNYLGFCGGAGLATLDGIGLLNIRRRPTRERVPSFSGKIKLNLSEHAIWKGIAEPVFHAWWPSQFLPDGNDNCLLAAYAQALPESFSSDLNVGDMAEFGDWHEKEKLYGINLDPNRLLNEPSVIEGTYGKGKVLLSLVHFDTTHDENGAMVLKNLWNYLGIWQAGTAEFPAFQSSSPPTLQTSGLVADLESAVDELIFVGLRNFLWFWRNPMLLQWRRGVRGLEYCTLYVMIKEISEVIGSSDASSPFITDCIAHIKNLLIPFVEKAKRLLVLERHAIQNGHVTYEKCDIPEIQKIRTELFSSSKSYGGQYKELIDHIDGFLYALLSGRPQAYL